MISRNTMAAGLMCAGLVAAQPNAATMIGVSIAHFDESVLTLIINASKGKADETGTQVQFEDAQGDTQKQISQVQNFRVRHINAMIVNAVNSSATAKMTEGATTAKIPLVYVNPGPADADLPAGVKFVYPDEHVSGRLQGETIAVAANNGEMAKGTLAVPVFQDAKSQDRVAVDTALKMTQGEKDGSHVTVPFELVSKANDTSYVGR